MVALAGALQAPPWRQWGACGKLSLHPKHSNPFFETRFEQRSPWWYSQRHDGVTQKHLYPFSEALLSNGAMLLLGFFEALLPDVATLLLGRRFVMASGITCETSMASK